MIAAHVPMSATDCSGATIDFRIWEIIDMGAGTTPLQFTFPTPMEGTANTKVCLLAESTDLTSTYLSAVGYYGG